ncbi:ankyrin repeat domain-containing protein [Streptomyces sp. NPDC087440]|uniref:ankyrin repeat domain-containing protein n=1 Tax=Streptomyces sp. NPDC087440 TaxID=3365790 RepID=UPI00380AA630
MDHDPTAGLRDLFEAVHGGEDDAVVRLLRAGVPAEATDFDGTSALYAAAVNDRPGTVRSLLAAGADPDRACGPEGGDLPLCAAAVGGHTEVVRALLAAGARPDLREEYGFTALTWAAGRGHASTVAELLAHGADPDLPGPGGESALVLAARRGSPATVRALLRHRAVDRKAALAEARGWLESDVEHAVRRRLQQLYGVRQGDAFAARRVVEEGGTTLVVELLRDGIPVASEEQQTGHAAVVTRLECVVGVRTPAAELVERAVRSGNPEGNDWREAVAALWQRADEETFRAARSWCARDTTPSGFLHQTFAADVLARVGARDAAVPLLRELAAREGSVCLTRAAVRALGRHGDAVGVLGRVGHPDAGVRERVARALGRVGFAEPAVDALIVLARDGDLGVRGAAVEGLARAVENGVVSDPVREVLAEQVGAGALGRGGAEEVGAGGAGWAGAEQGAPGAERAAPLARPSRPRGAAPPPKGGGAESGAAEGDGVGSGVATGGGEGRGALAVGDPVYAEAARGLAACQDPRAVSALWRVLVDGEPGSPAHRIARDALVHVQDEKVRRRLEWTSPRLR